MSKFKNLERVAIKELEKLDSAYEGKTEFTKEDAEKFRMLAHAWKSLLTAEAMHEAEEMADESGRSFGRGRNSYTNPRHMEYEMNGGLSGHYPPSWYPVSYNDGRHYW